jgi:hypothetical protein
MSLFSFPSPDACHCLGLFLPVVSRVRGFESFGDFLRRKKRLKSLAKDSRLLGTYFLNFKNIFADKKSRIKSKFVVFSGFIERFFK